MKLDLPLLKAFDNFPIYFGFQRHFSTPFVTSKIARRVNQHFFPRSKPVAPDFNHAMLVLALMERIHESAYLIRGYAMQMVSLAKEPNMREVMEAIVLARDPCKLVRRIVKRVNFTTPKRKSDEKQNSNAVHGHSRSTLSDLFKAGKSQSGAGREQPAGRRKGKYS